MRDQPGRMSQNAFAILDPERLLSRVVPELFQLDILVFRGLPAAVPTDTRRRRQAVERRVVEGVAVSPGNRRERRPWPNVSVKKCM